MSASAPKTALASAALVLLVGLPLIYLKHSRPTPAAGASSHRELATTEDAQAFDLLWRRLSSMLAKPEQRDAAELERQVVAQTAEYLELDGPHGDRFAGQVRIALGQLAAARARMTEANSEAEFATQDAEAAPSRRQASERLRRDQLEAADTLREALLREPRHALLEEKLLAWLLRLDYCLQRSSGRDPRSDR